MRLPSPEALTISAVINTGDLGTATARGLCPEHFAGFAPEWEFLSRYQRDYAGALPSPEVMGTVFPDFPYRGGVTEVAFYADQVLQRADRRTVRAALLSGTALANAGDLTGALAAMGSVSLARRAQTCLDAVTATLVLDEIGAPRVPAISYPWPTLHRATGGMRAGDFAVFAARTTIGKTWALCYAAVDAALAGQHVVYLSLEMPTEQMLIRLHACLGHRLGIPVSHKALRERREDRERYKRLLEAMETRVTGRLHVVDTSAGRISPATLAMHADADLVIVDHLGLMASDGVRAVDDWRRMAAYSNSVKEAAIAGSVAVLTAAQLNREGAARRGMPELVDIAQSDAIGQDADTVVMMRRMAGPAMKYHLAKNRHGENDLLFYSEFRPDGGRLREITRDAAEDCCDDAAAG